MAHVVEILPHKRQGPVYRTYLQTSNIKCTLVGNKIIHHSDVVEA